MTDIEISKSIKMKNINEIAKAINIENNIEQYGNYKAKINFNSNEKKGKLVLVTAINPTPLGEGKTTVSISLSDALNSLGYKSIVDLREPSLGPVFGLKGGATGGGYAQVVPMTDINLHFTGDIHAITSANNLLSSAIYNHIYFGNELGIEKILFNRCIDLNDRTLRNVKFDIKDKEYTDSFNITAASEIMSILCLSKNMDDLRNRLENIIIGINKDNKIIKAKQLNIVGSLMALLKDAMKPNLVQTLENNPAFIHGGPFANISIGCSSVISTKLALSLSDYTITEAGFGADLGAEKFFDIKCRDGLIPDSVVLVVTLKSLKYHGGCPTLECELENTGYLEKGLSNLYTHVENIKNVFGLNVIVAINKFSSDIDEELNYLCSKLDEKNIEYSICDGYSKGSKGSIDLAKKLVNMDSSNFKYAYELEDDIKTKIYKVCTKVYRANNVIYSDLASKKISEIEKLSYRLPICIAKTQYSLSDDPKNLLCDSEYNINITDVELKLGAGFIIIYTGNVLTMPGLPKNPNYEKIDIIDNEITGIF